MKPLARLHLLRQRLYEKNCPDDLGIYYLSFFKFFEFFFFSFLYTNLFMYTGEDVVSENKACATGPWSKWSKCNVDCGKGSKYRQRAYINEDQATRMECKKELTQRDECFGSQPNCESNNSGIPYTYKMERDENDV